MDLHFYPFAAFSAVILLLLAAWSIGGISVRKLDAAGDPAHRRFSSMDLFLLRCINGLNIIALAGIILGSAGLLPSYVPLLVIAGCLLPGILDAWAGRRSLLRSLAPTASSFGSALAGVTLLAMAAPLAVTFGAALCLPTGWDELVYHHSIPARWLRDGFPAVYMDLPYSGYPSLVAVLCWLIAPIDVYAAPRLLVWLCWLLSLLILRQILMVKLRRPAANLITATVLISPAMLMTSANCYAESLVAMNLLGMLLVLFRVDQTAESKRQSSAVYVVLGILAGGAAAIKLTGLVMIAVPLIWQLGTFDRRQHLMTNVIRGAIPGLIAMGFALPFYARVWWFTGNPFYPWFHWWFSDNTAAILMSRFHHDIGGAGFGMHDATAFFANPFLLTSHDKLFDGHFGWQLIPMLALSFTAIFVSIQSPGKNCIRPLALIATTLYTFWFFTAQQARFAVPAFMVCAVLSASGVALLGSVKQYVAIAAVVVGACISLPVRTAGYYLGSWETLAGRWTWTQYVEDGTGPEYIRLIQSIEQLTRRDAKILLLFEHRTFFVPRQCTICTPYFQQGGFTPAEEFSDPSRVVDLINSYDATHLIMARSPIGPDLAPDWWTQLGPMLSGIDQCITQNQLTVVWESEVYLILELPIHRVE